jgi:hypothetical protein
MTTLTRMERTATGWKCPRCGSTQEDTILPVRAVECNCAGLEWLPMPHKDANTESEMEAPDAARREAEAITGIPDHILYPRKT